MNNASRYHISNTKLTNLLRSRENYKGDLLSPLALKLEASDSFDSPHGGSLFPPPSPGLPLSLETWGAQDTFIGIEGTVTQSQANSPPRRMATPRVPRSQSPSPKRDRSRQATQRSLPLMAESIGYDHAHLLDQANERAQLDSDDHPPSEEEDILDVASPTNLSSHNRVIKVKKQHNQKQVYLPIPPLPVPSEEPLIMSSRSSVRSDLSKLSVSHTSPTSVSSKGSGGRHSGRGLRWPETPGSVRSIQSAVGEHDDEEDLSVSADFVEVCIACVYIILCISVFCSYRYMYIYI